MRVAWVLLICAAFGLPFSAHANTFLENFTTATHLDHTNTTGLWNTVDNVAQAAVVANNITIDFGDGSDGVLNTSTGFSFDTNAHPNGYNFISVNISGGTISVTGSNPLIIRSLTTIVISPTVSVGGVAVAATIDGQNGQPSAVASATGPTGGSAIASVVNGGQGGSAFSTVTASDLNGGAGENSDTTLDATTPGAGSINGATDGSPGTADIAERPGAIAAWPTGFNSGTAGGGGGGYFVAIGDAATGGSGGAGGGTIRLVAVGNLTVGTIDASGGSGGDSAKSPGSARCSGGGAGGNGGAIWLQSFKTVTSTALTVNAGAGGAAGGGCAGGTAGSSGFPGRSRFDAAAAGSFQTASPSASTSYVIQSTGYDLGTSDAIFTTAPTVISSAGGGTTPTVQYAGSSDDSNFSPFTSDITTLSDQGYRYLKFQIQLTTGVAGASPTVSSISVSFSGPSDTVTGLGLAAGCASLERVRPRGRGDSGGDPTDKTGMMMIALWGLFYLGVWRGLRLITTVKA